MTYYVTQMDVDDDVQCEIFRSVSRQSAEDMVAELSDWFVGWFEVLDKKPQHHLMEYDPCLHHTYNRHLLRGFLEEPVKDTKKPNLLVIDGGVS